MNITHVEAQEIKDSRGNATIKVVLSNDRVHADGAVPSGRSTGSKEALELRDSDGSVKTAIKNVAEEISALLKGRSWETPTDIDRAMIELDGTENKSRLGANALLGASIAAHRLFAAEQHIPLWKLISHVYETKPKSPRLYMNVMNGGAHAGFRLPFQEYMLITSGATAKESYDRAQAAFATLGTTIKARSGDVPLGDEGGYSPVFPDVEMPFSLLSEISAGFSHAAIGIDAAASEFYKKGTYFISGSAYTREDLLAFYRTLIDTHRVVSIEDPFAEDDVEGFTSLVEEAGERALIVGDDLTVTNPKLIAKFAESKSATGVILKPNQIGTVMETCEASRIAREAGWELIVSHRSGETLDTFIADLAFGIGAYGFKAGAPTQEVRRVKYERLIEAENEFLHN